MTEETRIKMTEKELYEKSLSLYNEIELLKVDLKELKEEFADDDKERKSRSTEIQAVASLVARCKESEEVDKMEQKIETIKEFTG